MIPLHLTYGGKYDTFTPEVIKMKTCTVKNCNNKYRAKGLCAKHYAQLLRHGKVRERTLREPNEIIIKNNIAEIILYDRESNEKARTIIDVEDVGKVKNKKWYVTSQGYVKSNKINLHRFLLEPIPKNLTVDHINRDTLDNRKENLRYATRSEQNKNRKTPSHIEKSKRPLIINNVYYDSMSKASKELNISIETIRGWLNGSKPTKPKYKGFVVKEVK